MPAVEFYWQGVEKLQARLAAAPAVAELQLASNLYKAGQAILAASVRITPIDKGALRASGHVDPPTPVPGGVEVRIGYGGASAPYALIVHERLDVYHKPPTQAKYLEQPVMEAAPGLATSLGLKLEPWG